MEDSMPEIQAVNEQRRLMSKHFILLLENICKSQYQGILSVDASIEMAKQVGMIVAPFLGQGQDAEIMADIANAVAKGISHSQRTKSIPREEIEAFIAEHKLDINLN